MDGPYDKFKKQREEAEKEIARMNLDLMELKRRKEREIPEKLDKLILQENGGPNSNEKWYKKPVGIITLSVSGSLIILLIKYWFGL